MYCHKMGTARQHIMQCRRKGLELKPTNQSRHARMAVAATAPACQQQQQQQCTCGIVIVDHGSRRKASNDMLEEFCHLYQQITQQPIVEPAHMEIAEPTIAQAVGRCIAAGAKHVIIAPYFLSKGRHIQDDIPALVAAAGEQFPDITCSIAEPIGIDPLMAQLIHNRVRAALPQQCPNLGTAWGSAPLTGASPVGMAVAAVHKQEQKQ